MQTDSHDTPKDHECSLALLTPDEAAKMLRLSKASIYRLVENRLITFYRVSGSLRFAASDLEEYIKCSRVESIARKEGDIMV